MILLGHGLPPAAARACFAEAGRLDPRQPRWPYLQGVSLADADGAAALPHLRRAADLCGDDPDAPRLRLAELLLAQGRPDEAAAQFRRTIGHRPDNARAHLGLARLAAERNALVEAQSHLDVAALADETRKASRLLLAEVHQRQGDAEAAAGELRRAAALPEDASWPDPFLDDVARLHTGKQFALERADRLLQAGQTGEALTVLLDTVRDYPEADWGWLLLGRVYLERKELYLAEEALGKAVALAPESVEPQFYLGLALYFQGKHQPAADHFRRATRLKPSFGLAHYNLGHCLLHLGDRKGATEAFRTAIACKPDYANAHVNLAELLLGDGQKTEAIKHLRYALQLDPASPKARQLLKRTEGDGSAGP
jgi:tetratricopeptide (TPR) repeat protein